MNIALLTAAGSGTRMHQDIPKQFMHIDDKPIIIHTLEKFQNHPNIDSIIVVTLNSWIEVLRAYSRQFNITKLKWIVPGGKTGQESIYNGIKTLLDECELDDVVMIHDGNRCMVSSEIISSSLAVYAECGSAVAAIPCTEAVFRSSDGVSSSVSIPRDELWRTQTPHTYSLGKLRWAHEQAKKFEIADSVATCTLMQQLGEKIFFSKGSEENLKITTIEDLRIFQALLHTQENDWIK